MNRPLLISRLLFPRLVRNSQFAEFLAQRGGSWHPKKWTAMLVEIGGCIAGLSLILVARGVQAQQPEVATALCFAALVIGFGAIRQATLIRFQEWVSTTLQNNR